MVFFRSLCVASTLQTREGACKASSTGFKLQQCVFISANYAPPALFFYSQADSFPQSNTTVGGADNSYVLCIETS